ncbi:MAG: GTP cyclohydrolase FolE2 [Pseudomonadota bacterium]
MTTSELSDVQGRRDERATAIEAAGVSGLRIPITVTDRGGRQQHTVATASLSVDVPADRKGAHMSRFVQVITSNSASVSVTGMGDLARTMIERLEADSGEISLTFPYFVDKAAPVSGEVGPMDYEATLRVRIDRQQTEAWVTVAVPATSLCPCSKEISDYSAHNQRSIITISITRFDDAAPVWLEDLIEIGETAASCPVYAVLKRVDEKHVTEAAYDNPKFVEDIVRDLAAPLDADGRISRYDIHVDNMESIHNHSAFARIRRDKR